MSIPRMRTIKEAFEELKKADPETSYTLTALKRAVKCGQISVIKAGNKSLINLDTMFDYLNTPSADEREKISKYEGKSSGKIRPLT